MAYPEKELLEQHLVGHKIERRFICDICGAGLKRKEHLERHKLGHNPREAGFKRKEHLNLHFVIHSGEKTEICGECGKGFYRKDHLEEAREVAHHEAGRRSRRRGHRDSSARSRRRAAARRGRRRLPSRLVGVPNSQIQIPVQIQVPQHHIQVSASHEEDADNPVSTVVLPTATEGLSILPN
ncbi:hypothetical protein NQ318_014047 [Aromia moschata]|uniref:C2H2-type domain-containing protein n=1 Tax=Aromia moschata TaxID=1265417 RepID=A0AAV8YYN1_9CUCU|nr:hypothetical protein NQ318_014047 [Aromia moschata]